MQVADSGLYTCEVRNAPDVDGKTYVDIQVTVLRKLTLIKAHILYTLGFKLTNNRNAKRSDIVNFKWWNKVSAK